MPECVALPCIPKIILAQDAVDLHIPPWMVDGMDGKAEEVQDEAEYIEVTIRRRSRIENEVRDVFVPATKRIVSSSCLHRACRQLA